MEATRLEFSHLPSSMFKALHSSSASTPYPILLFLSLSISFPLLVYKHAQVALTLKQNNFSTLCPIVATALGYFPFIQIFPKPTD